MYIVIPNHTSVKIEPPPVYWSTIHTSVKIEPPPVYWSTIRYCLTRLIRTPFAPRHPTQALSSVEVSLLFVPIGQDTVLIPGRIPVLPRCLHKSVPSGVAN